MQPTRLGDSGSSSLLDRLLQAHIIIIVSVSLIIFAVSVGIWSVVNHANRNAQIEANTVSHQSSGSNTVVVRDISSPNAQVAPPSPQPAPQVQQNDIATVDTTVTNFMRKYTIPGVSLAVTKDDKLIYAKSYGQIGPKTTTPVNNENLFRIASISKPITSAGIMKLIEAGKLKTSSHVFGPDGVLGQDYPSAPAVDNDITVDNLLHHTVGVWGNDGNDPMFKHLDYSQQQLISWTLTNYPANRNRGHFAYSNFGYLLLGRVIEKVSGKSYAQYIKDTVLKPSGISDMQIAGNKLADRKPNEVIYYGQEGADPYGMNVTRMDSHGGWLATATDLARFVAHVDGFQGVPDILKSSTVQTMTKLNANQYADGWSVNRVGNWWHTGALPGTATEVIRGANGYSWVILCNSRSYDKDFDADLDNLLWPLVDNKSTPWQDINQF